MTEPHTDSTAAQVERMLQRRTPESRSQRLATDGANQTTNRQLAAVNARRVANIADEDAYEAARAGLTPRERSLARRMRAADAEEEE